MAMLQFFISEIYLYTIGKWNASCGCSVYDENGYIPIQTHQVRNCDMVLANDRVREKIIESVKFEKEMFGEECENYAFIPIYFRYYSKKCLSAVLHGSKSNLSAIFYILK